MLTSTGLYKTYIHRPEQRAFRIELYAGDTGTLLQRIDDGDAVFSGTISATLDRRVTRTAELEFGAELWPGSNASAPLTPYQTVAKIYAGARYGDGSTELFQLMEGRVAEVQRNDDGTVSARFDDRAADVVGFNFETPRNSENVSIVNQVRRLITDVLPGAGFGPDDVDASVMTPKLTWDESRGDALDTLAGALGARWYQLGNGNFVLRAVPYDVGTVVATITDGQDGLLFTGSPSLTRDGAANSITVVVERADGGTPFRVTARDTSPTSPTRFGGPFGKITKLIKVQTPLTTGQATALARSELSAATALSSQWHVSCTADYTLEPGDTVSLTSGGYSSVQLIDSITYPIGTGAMSLGTRAFVRAPATVS